jgi:hypothetical protein
MRQRLHRLPIVILAAVLAVSFPAIALAQAGSSSSVPQARPANAPPIGVRIFGVVEPELMRASQSFDAVTGSSMLVGFGAGADILNVWRQLFVRAAFSTASASGERAYVVGSDVIPNGLTIDVGMRTFEVGAGWRAPMKKHPNYAIYFGGGALFVSYTEDSQLAAAGDNVAESFRGYAVEAGFDTTFAKRFSAAFEGQFRIVPNALGEAGASKSYGETDLGGLAIRVMIGVKLGK